LLTFHIARSSIVHVRYRKFGGRAKKGTKVAVVLSGCGVYDGSEITESVAVLVKCSQAGAEVQCFAPDRNQMHVVDHELGEVRGYAPRSVLQEAARVARGNIQALSKLNAQEYSAVIFPGGFGAAKNLR
jgi:enhancing lycopene biosynthesis protein 2